MTLQAAHAHIVVRASSDGRDPRPTRPARARLQHLPGHRGAPPKPGEPGAARAFADVFGIEVEIDVMVYA
jgi:hypothetical protein